MLRKTPADLAAGWGIDDSRIPTLQRFCQVFCMTTPRLPKQNHQKTAFKTEPKAIRSNDRSR